MKILNSKIQVAFNSFTTLKIKIGNEQYRNKIKLSYPLPKIDNKK